MEEEYSLENAKKFIKQRFMEQGGFPDPEGRSV